MDATAGPDWGEDQASQPDQDAVYAEFQARASAQTKGAIAGAAELVADIVASCLPESTFKPLAAAIAKTTGLSDTALRTQMEKGRKARDRAADDDEPAAPLRTREELEGACSRILAAPDVLALLKTDLAALGIAGSGRVVMEVYVAAQSRHLPKPIHGAVAGPSGIGKSYETDTALDLISPIDIYRIGDGSEKFFQYDTTALTGKVVYFIEATPLQRDSNSPLAYAIRTLMSEGVAYYRSVDYETKDRDGRPTALEIERRGPSTVIITSTADRLHPEIETRVVRFAVDGSAAQTARILNAMAQYLDAPPPDLIRDE